MKVEKATTLAEAPEAGAGAGATGVQGAGGALAGAGAGVGVFWAVTVPATTASATPRDAGPRNAGQSPSSAPAGAGGLIFLPYLNGERTPNLPLGKGVLYGLTTDTMQPGKGYWVKASENGTLAVGGGFAASAKRVVTS